MGSSARLKVQKWIERRRSVVTKDVRDVVAQYEVEFQGDVLGLDLETDFYGKHAVVKGIQPKSAASRVGCIKVGHIVIAVNRKSLLDCSFTQIMTALRDARQPRSIRFLDPTTMSIDETIHEEVLANRDLYGFAKNDQYIIGHRKHHRERRDKTYSNEMQWVEFISAQGGLSVLNDQFSKSRSSFERQHLEDLVEPLVLDGIPAAFRSEIWKIFAGVAKYKALFPPDYYEKLAESSLDVQIQEDIGKDVGRTFPEHHFYQSLIGKETLRKVLSLYALHNPDIGYCQSMNFIVGIILLFVEEESAFWLFAVMMTEYLPYESYTHSMVGAQVDQCVFQKLVEMELPDIHQKLSKAGIQIQLITLQWFLCAYVQTLPSETVLRVWDWFFLKGKEVMFDVAVAILKLYEQQIMRTLETYDLFTLIREMGFDLHDSDYLMQILGEMSKYKTIDLKYMSDTSRLNPKDKLLQAWERFSAKFNTPFSNIQDESTRRILSSSSRIYKKTFSWSDIIQWRKEFRPSASLACDPGKKKDLYSLSENTLSAKREEL